MFALNCNIINHTKLFIIYFISFIAIIRSQENNCISKEVDTKQILKKKCETISNGNNVCVQNNGIFIYNSVLPMFYLITIFPPLQILQRG